MKSNQLLTKTAINVDDILVKRNRDKVHNSIIFMVIMALVLWSVNVTIIEDTDWERMGSLGEVLASAGRFIGVDYWTSRKFVLRNNNSRMFIYY